jgi:hypothetical protein
MTIIATLSGFTPWTLLVNEAAAHVTECPRPLIEQALRKACREFFSTSRCWRAKNLTLATTVASQRAYAFNPPANAELLDVHVCWYGTEEVFVGHPGDDEDYYPTETSSDYAITVADGGATVLIDPLPVAAGQVLKGDVSYTLAANATGVPTWVYDEYREELACGAAARLVTQPKKPWTDREAYALHRKEFEMAMSYASNKAGPIRRRPLRTVPV